MIFETLNARGTALLQSDLVNLTLTTDRLNPKISNAPWTSKKQTLGNHSVLFLK